MSGKIVMMSKRIEVAGWEIKVKSLIDSIIVNNKIDNRWRGMVN